MGILSWVMIGLITGFAVKWSLPDKLPGSFTTAVLLGVCGAAVGGFLGTFGGIGRASEFDVGSLLAAIAGALIALFAFPDAASQVAYRLRSRNSQDDEAAAPAELEPEDQLTS